MGDFMTELLSPVGNMECLMAAINAGCDAVYLAGKAFGARGFAGNFSKEELQEAVTICHLYGVKVYVTVNTLIYDNEVESFIKYIDFLHTISVDAVIIQDLGKRNFHICTNSAKQNVLPQGSAYSNRDFLN